MTDIAEHIFLAIFVIELVLKIKVYGWSSYCPTNPMTRGSFIDMMPVTVTGVLFRWEPSFSGR